jgi:hypothetical protein
MKNNKNNFIAKVDTSQPKEVTREDVLKMFRMLTKGNLQFDKEKLEQYINSNNVGDLLDKVDCKIICMLSKYCCENKEKNLNVSKNYMNIFGKLKREAIETFSKELRDADNTLLPLKIEKAIKEAEEEQPSFNELG